MIATNEIMKARYCAALRLVLALLTTLRQIVNEDFPATGDNVTRYQIDALNGLAGELSALIEGYERR